MICPSCNTPGVVHSYGHDGNGPCKDWPRCPRCSGAVKADASDTGGSWKSIRLELGLCDICAIREECARQYVKKPGDVLIINGYTYSAPRSDTVPLGAPDPHPHTPMRGMAGRRFDFERFDGSPPQSCYSLWAGDEVDEYSRERMPDNARFLNGASKREVGEITCFNPSEAA